MATILFIILNYDFPNWSQPLKCELFQNVYQTIEALLKYIRLIELTRIVKACLYQCFTNFAWLILSGQNSLRVDMQDWSGNSRYLTFTHFMVLPESNRYQMSISGPYGNIPDDMSYSNGCQFGTYDNPDYYHCAVNMHAGWWYNYCAYAMPNGHYYVGGPYPHTGGFYDGIYWKDWHGYDYALKFIAMSVYRS